MKEITDTQFEAYAKKYDRMLRSFANNISSVYMTPDDYYVIMLEVLLDCMRDFDDTRNTKFSSYLYNSLNLRMMTEFKKVRKDLMLVRDSSDVEIGGERDTIITEHVSDDLTPDTAAYAEDIKDYLLTLPDGEMSYDIIVNGTTYTDMAKRMNIHHTTVMRKHEKVLEELQNFFKI